jgi:hypothetical protein
MAFTATAAVAETAGMPGTKEKQRSDDPERRSRLTAI